MQRARRELKCLCNRRLTRLRIHIMRLRIHIVRLMRIARLRTRLLIRSSYCCVLWPDDVRCSPALPRRRVATPPTRPVPSSAKSCTPKGVRPPHRSVLRPDAALSTSGVLPSEFRREESPPQAATAHWFSCCSSPLLPPVLCCCSPAAATAHLRRDSAAAAASSRPPEMQR